MEGRVEDGCGGACRAADDMSGRHDAGGPGTMIPGGLCGGVLSLSWCCGWCLTRPCSAHGRPMMAMRLTPLASRFLSPIRLAQQS